MAAWKDAVTVNDWWLNMRLKSFALDSEAMKSLATYTGELLQRESRILWAVVDLSDNQISDASLVALLDVFEKHGVVLKNLKLFKNWIGDEAGMRLAQYIEYQQEPVEQLHLSHNLFTGRTLISICLAIGYHRWGAYPYIGPNDENTPCWVRLENNNIIDAPKCLDLLQDQTDVWFCLADDRHGCGTRGCIKATASKYDGPAVHLFSILNQGRKQHGAAVGPPETEQELTELIRDSIEKYGTNGASEKWGSILSLSHSPSNGEKAWPVGETETWSITGSSSKCTSENWGTSLSSSDGAKTYSPEKSGGGVEPSYVGFLKEHRQGGFRFIKCPELQSEYGRDVFMHCSTNPDAFDLEVGAKVEFYYYLHRGQPQAHGAHPVPDDSRSASVASSPPTAASSAATASAAPSSGQEKAKRMPTQSSPSQKVKTMNSDDLQHLERSSAGNTSPDVSTQSHKTSSQSPTHQPSVPKNSDGSSQRPQNATAGGVVSPSVSPSGYSSWADLLHRRPPGAAPEPNSPKCPSEELIRAFLPAPGPGSRDLALPPELRICPEQLLQEDSTMVCTVCTMLVYEPVVTRCTHLFCYGCMSDWLHAQLKTGGSKAATVSCPTCLSDLKHGDITLLSGGTGAQALLWRFYNDQMIICARHSSLQEGANCKWQGKLKDYRRHILSDCKS